MQLGLQIVSMLNSQYGSRKTLPPRLEFHNDPAAEPVASTPLSHTVNGTWPG